MSRRASYLLSFRRAVLCVLSSSSNYHIFGGGGVTPKTSFSSSYTPPSRQRTEQQGNSQGRWENKGKGNGFGNTGYGMGPGRHIHPSILSCFVQHFTSSSKQRELHSKITSISTLSSGRRLCDGGDESNSFASYWYLCFASSGGSVSLSHRQDGFVELRAFGSLVFSSYPCFPRCFSLSILLFFVCACEASRNRHPGPATRFPHREARRRGSRTHLGLALRRELRVVMDDAAGDERWGAVLLFE